MRALHTGSAGRATEPLIDREILITVLQYAWLEVVSLSLLGRRRALKGGSLDMCLACESGPGQHDRLHPTLTARARPRAYLCAHFRSIFQTL
jgi:hypothetical protein